MVPGALAGPSNMLVRGPGGPQPPGPVPMGGPPSKYKQ